MWNNGEIAWPLIPASSSELALNLPSHMAETPIDLDIAVVGGGVSGVYSAWRLMQAPAASLPPEVRGKDAGAKLQIAVFETTSRIGGRLFSARLPGVEKIPVELGGMRFLNSHRRVCSLVERFKLEFRPLVVDDPNLANLNYLRGRRFTRRQIGDPGFEPPYLLERGERGRSPGSLLIEVALRHRDLVRVYPERYRNIGFWNLLCSENELSDEAYRYVRDGGGYDTIVNNWTAAEAIPFLLADFAPDAVYYRLVNGFQSLPLTLEREFRKEGGTTYRGYRLHRIDIEGDGRFKLTFDQAGFVPGLDGRRVQKEQIVRARSVVLAMPRGAIENLHPDSAIFDSPQFSEDVRAVLAQQGYKIFAAYRRPWWWAKRGVTAGRSVTDLPVRQCYYWASQSFNSQGDVQPDGTGNGNSILMASYNDDRSVEFWSGLMRQTERYVPDPRIIPPGVALPDRLGDVGEDFLGAKMSGVVRVAPAALVRELQSQLRELHGLASLQDPESSDVIDPYFVAVQDWSQPPYNGGWHFWRIGVNASQVSLRIQRPLEKHPLFICGEAWSRQQGWVEGALETADQVLSRYFGQDPLVSH